MKLTALKDKELCQVSAACEAMIEAMLILLDSGSVSEDEESGLDELAEAVVAEGDRRAKEDVDFYVGQGKVRPIIRPDGQIGYGLVGGDEEA